MEPRYQPDYEPDYEYSPIKAGPTWRELLRRLFAPLVALGVLLFKFGAFSLKFFGIFISGSFCIFSDAASQASRDGQSM